MWTGKHPDEITECQKPSRVYPRRGDLLQRIHELDFKIIDFCTVIP